ncbi:MAG: DUF6249 domain-containing protein [Chthoniobacterales bacterium]
MKTTFFSGLCAVALALTASAQTPTPFDPATATAAPGDVTTPAPYATPAGAAASLTPAVAATVAPVATAAPIAPPAPVATLAPTVAPSASPDNEDDFDKAIERKINKHFKINLDGSDHVVSGEDVPWIAIPIVLIVFLTIFGLPVAIVGIILYFSFSRSRAMHKTVRMMVEKGQPVPEALLNPPPVIRQRSDLRRGVVLLMIGTGLMVFFGACNDWEGGAWSLGAIPFLIGLGYLLVWKLDVRREDTSPRV